MITYTPTKTRNAEALLTTMIDIYSTLLDKFKENIIEPYIHGNDDKYKHNLSKLGKGMTLLRLFNTLLNGLAVLLPIMKKYKIREPLEENEFSEEELAKIVLRDCAELGIEVIQDPRNK